MKATTPALPLAFAGIGGVLGYLFQVALVSMGQPAFVPPFSFPLSLAAIAAIAVAVGWPIRQTLRGKRTERLDPFRAMRVVLLAKASVLVGALLGGASVGIVVHLSMRPVAASGDDLVRAVLSVVAGAAMLIAGLIVEQWCRVPPEDDESATLRLQGE